ncbi:protein N-lysine methyltransferase METTL21D [Culicoides brevitarsis]|uniref:protein N-lysine methyltransferase METTL21D n=1 Tax=Culicoides brevitarsis TaxID=469753 RepID=UPI00307C9E76
MTEPNYCIREFEINDDLCLDLHQIIEGQVSAVVWDASIVLARYLIHRCNSSPKYLKGKNILELGSGLGLCGMTACCLGAKSVLLTDLDEAIPLLQVNVDKNKEKFDKSTKVEVKALKWSTEDAAKLIENEIFDVILVSDCIYYEESIEPLIETLVTLLKEKETKVLLAQELRESQKQIDIFKKFIKTAREKIIFREISAAEQDPDYQCDEIMLYECSRK